MTGIVRSAIKPVRQLGLSLVELMVAILISMIVLAGVLQVMFTSKTTFVSQEEMSYIQENARFALDVIGRDIQAAGYLGCASSGAELALVGTVDDANAAEFWGPEAVVGFAGSDGIGEFPEAYSDQVRTIVGATGGDAIPDSIIVRGAEGVPRDVKAHSGTLIELDSVGDITAGDYLAVVGEDCVSAAVIRVAAVDGANVNYSGAICDDAIRSVPGQSLICDADCACTGTGTASAGYNAGAAVHAYNSKAYFIGTSNSAVDQPALKRVRLRDGKADLVEELALGVEDMELHYGVDTNGDGAAEIYVSASAFTTANVDWNQVVAVRVSLLFRSQSPSLADAQVQGDLLGNAYNDRYMRQVVTSTYRLRNRI